MRLIKNNQPNFIFLLFVLMLLLQSCFTSPKGTSKSAKRNYEVFYAGEKGNMYFLKPLEYTSSDATLFLDYTFTHREGIKSNVTIAFSIISPIIFKKLEEMKFISPGFATSTNEFSLLFNETHKKGFVSRFNSTIELSELEKLFSNPSYRVELIVDGTTFSFLPTQKTTKIQRNLNQHLFVFIRD
jgi:hypothetical protein